MPYKIVRVGKNRYRVINAVTGRVLSKGTTKRKAEAQIRVVKSSEGKSLIRGIHKPKR